MVFHWDRGDAWTKAQSVDAYNSLRSCWTDLTQQLKGITLQAKSCLAQSNTSFPSRGREGHPQTPVITAELILKSTLGMVQALSRLPSTQGWLQELQRDRAVPEPTWAEEGWEMQVVDAGLTEPPPAEPQPCPPSDWHCPQGCHRAATIWLSDVTLCPSIPPGTGATVFNAERTIKKTGKTNPWIALKLNFHLPKQRPLARESLTMHTQGQDTALREEAAAGVPSTSPDMLQAQGGELWDCTGPSQGACPLQQTDSKESPNPT